MPDIRQLVLDELERRGWSRTELTRHVSGVSQRQVLGWLAGHRGITISRVEPILEVLGLGVCSGWRCDESAYCCPRNIR